MGTSKKVTISDVAERAGVSKGTVSAVINQKPSVNALTRSRVLEAIRELNYRPKGTARSLRIEQSGTIGVIIKEINNPFFSSLILAVRNYAKEHGYSLFVASSEGDYLDEKHMIELLSVKDFDGLIIWPVLGNPAEINHLFSLKNMNCPFVLMEDLEGIHANVVRFDNRETYKNITRYLFDLGHSDIIHFTGPKYSSHSKERLAGFREAFSESPYIFDYQSMVFECGSTMDKGYRLGIEHFRDLPKEQFPTAVICFNDLTALGLMSAFHELGIQVPEDISVIGHDDIECAKRWHIPLTTVKAPTMELGENATEILIENIEAEEPVSIRKITLESKLNVRESTRALK